MLKLINQWSTRDFENHIDDILGKSFTVEKIEIAGDGNMNFTYRLVLKNNPSLIVKQSPSFCARFPDIPAPDKRILSEMRYYELANKDEYIARHSPEILGLDEKNRIAYISDLGTATDFEYLYAQKTAIDPDACSKLVKYLATLHNLTMPEEVEFNNFAMRELNHDYIFNLPFLPDDGAINLDEITPGLKEVVDEYKIDAELRNAAIKLGKLYFQKDKTLIHGDYYPMSWINTENGLFIIDPEFGFMGLPEIDLGFFLAHMLLSNNFEIALRSVKETYGPCDFELVAKFCAVEVIRRITYVSQLPILNSLSFKEELLSKSAMVLKTGEMEIYENSNYNIH